jgi:2,3-dihydroxybenzoate-AMP ligase
MEQAGVTTLLGSPFTLGQWLQRYPNGKSLPIVQVTGGKLESGLSSALLENFREVQDVYGSAEAGRVYTTKIRSVDSVVTATGHCHDTVIEIEESLDTDLMGKQSSIGRIRLINNHIICFTFNDATSEFERLANANSFLTEDIGVWHETSTLKIVGRMGNLVNVGGEKIAIEEIEAEISKAEKVRDVAAFEVVNPKGVKEIAAFVVLSDALDSVATLELV